MRALKSGRSAGLPALHPPARRSILTSLRNRNLPTPPSPSNPHPNYKQSNHQTALKRDGQEPQTLEAVPVEGLGKHNRSTSGVTRGC